MIGRAARTGRVALQQKTHRLTTLPVVIVYLNDICNSRCISCAIWENNARIRESSLRQMSDELLEALYAQMSRWRCSEVLLSGGEPTMHPRFVEVVDRIRRSAIGTKLVTNGLLLSGFPRADLRGISGFFISFDGPDAASYSSIRGVDGFDRVGDALDHIRPLSPRPSIVARCTLQRENVARLTELVDAARSFGFDQISFLAVDTESKAFGRSHENHSVAEDRIAPTSDDLERMMDAIETLERRGDGGFVESGTRKLREIHRYFLAKLGRADFPPVRCNAPWVSAVIETSGKLRGCFFHEVIGDFRDLNLERAVAFRRSLDPERDATCRQCVCSKYLSLRGVWNLS